LVGSTALIFVEMGLSKAGGSGFASAFVKTHSGGSAGSSNSRGAFSALLDGDVGGGGGISSGLEDGGGTFCGFGGSVAFFRGTGLFDDVFFFSTGDSKPAGFVGFGCGQKTGAVGTGWNLATTGMVEGTAG
jgi:hypothetical protein